MTQKYKLVFVVASYEVYAKHITFTVDNYTIKDGLIYFYDAVERVNKAFPVNKLAYLSEIEEVFS